MCSEGSIHPWNVSCSPTLQHFEVVLANFFAFRIWITVVFRSLILGDARSGKHPTSGRQSAVPSPGHPRNGGFLKWGYSQIIHLHRTFHYKPSILGYLNFRKLGIPSRALYRGECVWALSVSIWAFRNNCCSFMRRLIGCMRLLGCMNLQHPPRFIDTLPPSSRPPSPRKVATCSHLLTAANCSQQQPLAASSHLQPLAGK